MILEPNQAIPDFCQPDQNGDEKTFVDICGAKGLILYFYPKDNTPGCTTEAQNFRDEITAFQNLGLNVVGVSKDSAKVHTNFITKHELPFTLLSDPEAKMCEAFGVWQEKKNYGKVYMGIVRTTYIIDPSGIVLKTYPKVKVKGHVEQVLADCQELLA